MIALVLILLPLYAGTGALQSYDMYATLRIVQHGGREANPLLTELAEHPPAFIALKAGLTVLPIVSAEHMWKMHHRRRAVVMLLATDGLLAVVAAHNAAVLHHIPP